MATVTRHKHPQVMWGESTHFARRLGAALMAAVLPAPKSASFVTEPSTKRMLGALLLGASLVLASTPTPADTVRIAGIGASSCARFNQEIAQKPMIERDYLAWAQGFMSGALIRAPQGLDEDLDLLPPTFPIQKQAEFLRAFCAGHPEQDYMDAVRALYHRLRGPAA